MKCSIRTAILRASYRNNYIIRPSIIYRFKIEFCVDRIRCLDFYTVRSINIDTILIFLALYTQSIHTMDLFCFNLRVFTSKSGERCRNYNSFYMCLPLFKGPKVMGQINNHKSNFHFLILGCKSFAVNYSLKSGT